ncbi:Hypothetical_protein [Hexamita inflata]|uniref:Hypothetical_protein n=1 Tax=Hexamita inflata TaxID=28002 RepID=A0AA86P754_9EUKA|nr:Hypothetical protein HINF_LOCUS19012 [Hexamita inflata]
MQYPNEQLDAALQSAISRKQVNTNNYRIFETKQVNQSSKQIRYAHKSIIDSIVLREIELSTIQDILQLNKNSTDEIKQKPKYSLVGPQSLYFNEFRPIKIGSGLNADLKTTAQLAPIQVEIIQIDGKITIVNTGIEATVKQTGNYIQDAQFEQYVNVNGNRLKYMQRIELESKAIIRIGGEWWFWEQRDDIK